MLSVFSWGRILGGLLFLLGLDFRWGFFAWLVGGGFFSFYFLDLVWLLLFSPNTDLPGMNRKFTTLDAT